MLLCPTVAFVLFCFAFAILSPGQISCLSRCLGLFRGDGTMTIRVISQCVMGERAEEEQDT